MRARRKPGLVVVLLAFVGASSVASASQPSKRPPSVAPAAPKPVAVALPLSRVSIDVPLASLPQGKLLDQDWSGVPAALPAGGKVAGVTLKRSSERFGARSQTILQIEETKPKVAAGEESADASGSGTSPASLCFDTANVDGHSGSTRRVRRGRGAVVTEKLEGDDQPLDHWTGGMTTDTQVMRSQDVYGKFPLKDRVQQLHIEQLVLGAQGPVLESRDAWIDVQSGGARVHATAELPLRDLGERAIGVHLYAGRVGGEVVFVATQSKAARHLFAVRKDEGSSMTNCGHLSVRLDVKRGMSEMADFETQIEMREASAAKADDDNAKAAAGADDANDFRNGKARTSPTDPQDTTPITRTRLGRIALSTSWEPNDAGPLLSFSESWANRPHDE